MENMEQDFSRMRLGIVDHVMQQGLAESSHLVLGPDPEKAIEKMKRAILYEALTDSEIVSIKNGESVEKQVHLPSGAVISGRISKV